MPFQATSFNLSEDDLQLLHEQRNLTRQINNQVIQVGAIYLKPKSKLPADDNWALRKYLETKLEAWVDDPELVYTNVGFNLQLGWVDVDIDSDDPDFNRCIMAALRHLRIDSRFAFGRRSIGAPSHFMVQLTEEDAANFEELKRFEPKEIKINNARHKVQLRTSIPKSTKRLVEFSAQQTVVPGSIYVDKMDTNGHDISVWWQANGEIARTPDQVAATTSRRVTYRELVRAITYGSILYLTRPHWTEGNRQGVATRLFGWLARVVIEGESINDSEQLSSEVYCPIDSDIAAESLIELICNEFGDNEAYMRKRTFHDAIGKLRQNPDAKIPGWPAMEILFGVEAVQGLRNVISTGSSTSALSVLLDRYIYEEVTDYYIDREFFMIPGSRFAFPNKMLYTRHKPETIMIGGKPKEAFKSFEISKLRKQVTRADLFPDYQEGAIIRIANNKLVSEEYEGKSNLVFNTWTGWFHKPVLSPNLELLAKCESMLDTALGFLTCDNPRQIKWIKDWLAWTIQFPGDKQQIAWVILGSQGVGKSFIGNHFCGALLGSLHSTVATKLIGETFAIGPLVGRMLVFIDEARFKNAQQVDEIKLLIRNIRMGGEQKHQDPREYNIYARMMFAANGFDIGVGQANTTDRALYFTKTHSPQSMGVTEFKFREWAHSLKPFFEEFAIMIRDDYVMSHFMRLFTDRELVKSQIENITGSAAGDTAIIVGNLSPSRRIAKNIIEDGFLFDYLDITTPFTRVEFVNAVAERLKNAGDRIVNPEWILREFAELGMLETAKCGIVMKQRFRWKLGELQSKFGEATGIPLIPPYEFTEVDYGPNDNDGSKPVSFRGMVRGRF